MTLNLDAIAARAAVARQTIYRWWDSKSDILLAFLTTTDSGAGVQGPGRTGSALRRGRRPLRVRDHDIELALDELTGPVYYRVLMTRQAVPRSFTDALVDRYLASQETR